MKEFHHKENLLIFNFVSMSDGCSLNLVVPFHDVWKSNYYAVHLGLYSALHKLYLKKPGREKAPQILHASIT